MKIADIDGLTVINAKKPVTLHINRNDVAKADRKEPEDCVVARACRREMHAKEVRVHLGRIYVRTNEGNWTRYMTSKSMRDEIIAFDRGGQFEPGVFTLKEPPPTRQTGRHQGGPMKPRRLRKSTGKKRSPPHVVTNVRMGPA